MTEISHVTGKDNVVDDALSRYPELVDQSYDHLLPEEQEMDLLCGHLFNITSQYMWTLRWMCPESVYKSTSELVTNKKLDFL
jgi:hypothetical protein